MLYSNCLLAALWEWAKSPTKVKIRKVRNRSGRIHFVWEIDGKQYERYAKGRSTKSYISNLWYKGEIKRVR